MRLFTAVSIGKLISFISQTFKLGGGSAAPGFYALIIDSDLVTKLASKIPKNVIITGTNGKTTTARILTHLATESELKVIRNSTGSNLERGIASALINSSVKVDLGIWEMDEFAFNEVSPKIKPDLVLFLNVSRDQLDRYGEIDKVVNRWCETIAKLNPRTTILINAADPELFKLKSYFKGQIKDFGRIKNIKTTGLNGVSFDFSLLTSHFSLSLPLPGLYNIQNCVAALSAAHYLSIPITPLDKFQPAFGRFEKLPFGYIFLIKNPAGATAVFETLAPQIKKEDRLLIALNDNLADGTDVSWIWDADFERLLTHKTLQKSAGGASIPPQGWKIFVSGNRAYDLAVRLKYAGFDTKSIIVEPSLQKALKQAREGLKGQLYILPTYTALLELQSILVKKGVKSHYWKES